MDSLILEKESLDSVLEWDQETMLFIFEYNSICYLLISNSLGDNFLDTFKEIISLDVNKYSYYNLFLHKKKIDYLFESIDFNSNPYPLLKVEDVENEEDVVDSFLKIESIMKRIEEREKNTAALIEVIDKYFDKKKYSGFQNNESGINNFTFFEIKNFCKDILNIKLISMLKWLPLYKYIFIGEYINPLNIKNGSISNSFFYSFSFIYTTEIILNIKTLYEIIVFDKRDKLFDIRKNLEFFSFFENIFESVESNNWNII